MSLWSDAENAAGPSQTANDVDTAPVIDLSTVPGADESREIKVDDDGTRNVDNEQGIIEDTGARVIDGAHVILDRLGYLNHPERLYI
jgi:hypothetical protein